MDVRTRMCRHRFELPANVTLRVRMGHAAVAYKGGIIVFGGGTYDRSESRNNVITTNSVLQLVEGADGNEWKARFNRTLSERHTRRGEGGVGGWVGG